MRKRRNVLIGTAALLTRGVVRLVDAGARAVKSSTQGVQDLYREAKNEYDSERASVRTVGSPIVMSGSPPSSGSPIIYTSSEPPVSQSGTVLTPLIIQEASDGSLSGLETAGRKRGRPRKNPLLETSPAQGDKSSIIVGSDGKPAPKKRSAAPQEIAPSAPKPRGRPRRAAEAATDGQVGASSMGASSHTGGMLKSVNPLTISELDGTTEAPVVPDDLTIPGGISETPGDLNNVQDHHSFDSAGEAPVE